MSAEKNAILGELGKLVDLSFLSETVPNIDIPLGGVPPFLAYIANKAHAVPYIPNLQVVVTPSDNDANRLVSVLQAYLPSENVAIFPAWETLPHERLSPRADTISRRIQVLRRLSHPEEFTTLKILVMSVRSFLQPIPANLGDISPIRICVGDLCDTEILCTQLTDYAYTRVDMIESRGEYALRGGIIDIFPPNSEHPFRIELFGDEVEEIRSFSLADQRSIANVNELSALPCRELLLTPQVRAKAGDAIAEFSGMADMLEKISQGITVEGMEALTPILVDKMISIVEILGEDAQIIMVEPERVFTAAQALMQTTEEFLSAAWSAAVAGGEIPIQVQQASFLDVATVKSLAQKQGLEWLHFSGLPSEDSVSLDLEEPPHFSGNFSAALEYLQKNTRAGWRVVVAVEGAGTGKRLVEQFMGAHIPTKFITDLNTELADGVVYVVPMNVSAGFVAPTLSLAVLSAHDLLSRFRKHQPRSTTMPKRRKNVVDPLSLKPGDYVVHEKHGIAQFSRLIKYSMGGKSGGLREYMVLEYAPLKRGQARQELWVPTDRIDRISKYVGGDTPPLSRMGGNDWESTKRKARSAVKEIARELIRLYAQRRATAGFAFSPDTPWQRELEDAFEFIETPDQLVTIEEVKRDMESPEPMDRLISGDVGYGKTEIAVRAAFKAIQDGKQVAFLAPTTLLVQQHLETFNERYLGFPVKISSLSRFQSAKETTAVKKGLADGSVDLVIGTHKLITGDVRFKNLGLVIIDEEQRFGVEHKETLKQLYPSVDVLAMSATPIPRTLEMAVTGIRQMSTLATPPEERHPILTYVGAMEEKQISAAVKREMLRDGQVFYIHNRTQSIYKRAAELEKLLPNTNIGVAHGQMPEAQLEKVIQQFWDHEIDVLVCTTIVETGLDISNANTLIVEDAHKLGLSQLHQLRGRVGRGTERAYAYFLYPAGRNMTETALERLRTIATHTDLGSGTEVALKDLEIRGAGNLLGGQQSGHIVGVGFDLYIRMVSEAVARLTGQDDSDPDQELVDTRIELPVEAHIPQDWITSQRLRLEMYTKISATRSAEERAAIRAELIDRYGKLPEVVERLFAIAELRELAQRVGIEEIKLAGNNVRLAPISLSDFRQVRLKRLYPRAVVKPAVRAIMLPVTKEKSRILGEVERLADDEILAYITKFINAILISD